MCSSVQVPCVSIYLPLLPQSVTWACLHRNPLKRLRSRLLNSIIVCCTGTRRPPHTERNALPASLRQAPPHIKRSIGIQITCWKPKARFLRASTARDPFHEIYTKKRERSVCCCTGPSAKSMAGALLRTLQHFQ